MRGGKREGAGRKPGSLDRFSISVKEAVLETFQQLGGVAHMTEWAEKNPGDFYRIAAKLIPQAISGEVEHKHVHVNELSESEIDRELARRGIVAGEEEVLPSPQEPSRTH